MKHTRPAALLCTVPGRLIIKMHLLPERPDEAGTPVQKLI